MLASINAEKRRVQDSIFWPLLFVAILWGIKILEIVLNTRFVQFGIYPREISGLIGIVTAPLIHGNARAGDVLGNFSHLFSNTFPLIVLGFIILHSYRKIAPQLLGCIYIMSGILVWFFARSSFHIGASGVVYGMAFFIFFSGVFRKDIRSVALALLVVFLYGGIVWGLLPIQEGVSWEGHIAGAVAGTLAAYYFRKVNPPKRFAWESEEEEDPENVIDEPYWVPKKSPDAERKEIPIKDSDAILDWEVKYNFKAQNKEEK